MKFKRIILLSFLTVLILSLVSCQKQKPTIEQLYPYKEIAEPVAMPVLMYHNFTDIESEASDITVYKENFKEQIEALKNAGYTAITPMHLDLFLNKKSSLPEKPIIITMDDGYLSNLEIAAPILQQNDMNATIFVIGDWVGKEINPYTNEPFIPQKFSYKQAKKWIKKDVITLQSHSFDMHRHKSQGDGIRNGVLQKEKESEQEYIAALESDINLAINGLLENVSTPSVSVAFPYGYHSENACKAWAKAGVKIQFTTQYGCTFIKPEDNFEYQLFRRWSIGNDTTGKELIEGLEKLKNPEQ